MAGVRLWVFKGGAARPGFWNFTIASRTQAVVKHRQKISNCAAVRNAYEAERHFGRGQPLFARERCGVAWTRTHTQTSKSAQIRRRAG